MDINKLIKQPGEWLRDTGPHANIVMSSRIRLARNFADISFPSRATDDELERVLKTVSESITEIDMLKDVQFIKLMDLDKIDRQLLVERHLMSVDHAAHPQCKALIINNEEVLSIMVNEEDHLRLQVMHSGFDLNETWEIISKIDSALSEKMTFAYRRDWGFLTACPTNTGTAMRGSVMMHLPALVMTKQINKVMAAISKLSFASRGFYGEGSQAVGKFYQISNQVSLGHSETEIIQNINGLIHQIVQQEEQARQALLLQNRSMLEDKVGRAWGVLRHARIINSQETTELLSMVRLGLDVGLLEGVDRKTINDLLITTQPAHLQKIEGKKLDAFHRDTRRADLIRERLGG